MAVRCVNRSVHISCIKCRHPPYGQSWRRTICKSGIGPKTSNSPNHLLVLNRFSTRFSHTPVYFFLTSLNPDLLQLFYWYMPVLHYFFPASVSFLLRLFILSSLCLSVLPLFFSGILLTSTLLKKVTSYLLFSPLPCRALASFPSFTHVPHITFTYPFYFYTPTKRQIIWGSLLNLSTAEDYSGFSSTLSIRASSQVWHQLAVCI